jgi:hypothetical protein
MTFRTIWQSPFLRPKKQASVPPITFCKVHAQSKASLGVPRQLSEGCSAIAKHYHFNFGPEDQSNNVPNVKEKQSGRRRSKVEHGERVKRGCQAGFSATVQKFRPEVAETKLSSKAHCNKSGKICHGAKCIAEERHHTDPYLSTECKDFVRDPPPPECQGRCHSPA